MKFKNFDIEDVFGFDDTEQAKAYIGKKGYYADHIEKLDDYIENKSHIDTLYSIDKSYDIYRFIVGSSYDYSGYYTYFLPLDKVKNTEQVEKEVKYRPIKNMFELTDIMYGEERNREVISTGDLMTLERKKDRFRFRILITQLEYENDFKLVSINDKTLKNLFDDYNVMNVNGIFVPFGVEVKE